MDETERQEYIEERLTAEDIDRFHDQGEYTHNLATLMLKVGAEAIQIWGHPDGSEPVSVIIDE